MQLGSEHSIRSACRRNYCRDIVRFAVDPVVAPPILLDLGSVIKEFCRRARTSGMG